MTGHCYQTAVIYACSHGGVGAAAAGGVALYVAAVVHSRRGWRTLTALAGLALVGLGASGLWPSIRAHVADPAITIGITTLATYVRELFVDIDAVGPVGTAAAWAGVVLLAVAVAWPALARVPGETAAEVEEA